MEPKLPAQGLPGQEPELGDLVRQFLSGLDQRRQAMARALRERRPETLRHEAHQIKGTAGAMGYPLMTEQAGILERCVRSSPGERGMIRQELTTLNAMIDRALEGYERSSKTTEEQANER